MKTIPFTVHGNIDCENKKIYNVATRTDETDEGIERYVKIY